MSTLDIAFRRFQADISRITRPEKFTFPFYYEPHPLSIMASEELQRELESHILLAPLFDPASSECLPAGKMFGVLVVENQAGELGYLRGFSGKLGSFTHLEGFVPPVFDLWNKDSFFTKEEAVLNAINAQIETLQKESIYQHTKELLQQQIASEKKAIADKKQLLKQLKTERKVLREQQESQLNPLKFEAFNEDLIKQSLRDKHELRVLTTYWQEQIEATKQVILDFDLHINSLKEERKQKSNALQHQLFQQYRFLNYNQEEQDLLAIFEKTALQQPPAAAGDCAAPKLL